MKIELTKEEWRFVLKALKWIRGDKSALYGTPWLVSKKFDKLLEKLGSEWVDDE